MLQNSVLKNRLRFPFAGLLFAIALLAVAFSPRPAVAQVDGGATFSATFTAQFIGTQTCAQGDASCTACVNGNGFFVEAQGLSDSSMGPLFVQLFKCFYPNQPPFGTYAGTLTMTSPNGKDSLTWNYLGKNDNAGDFYGFGPFSGTLTLTAGTGKFDGARGSATFTAASGPSLTAGPSPLLIAGTAFYYVHGRFAASSDK
jgi:hypothetical protein